MKKVKITTKDYSYECGDGCCSEWGRKWYVNDVFVHCSPCDDNGWLAVLRHLEFDAAIEYQTEDGETVAEL